MCKYSWGLQNNYSLRIQLCTGFVFHSPSNDFNMNRQPQEHTPSLTHSRRKKYRKKRSDTGRESSMTRGSEVNRTSEKQIIQGRLVDLCSAQSYIPSLDNSQQKRGKSVWRSQGTAWQLPFCLAVLIYFLLSKCLAQWYVERRREKGEEVWLKTVGALILLAWLDSVWLCASARQSSICVSITAGQPAWRSLYLMASYSSLCLFLPILLLLAV